MRHSKLAAHTHSTQRSTFWKKVRFEFEIISAWLSLTCGNNNIHCPTLQRKSIKAACFHLQFSVFSIAFIEFQNFSLLNRIPAIAKRWIIMTLNKMLRNFIPGKHFPRLALQKNNCNWDYYGEKRALQTFLQIWFPSTFFHLKSFHGCCYLLKSRTQHWLLKWLSGRRQLLVAETKNIVNVLITFKFWEGIYATFYTLI